MTRQHGNTLQLILFILCFTVCGELQSISEANNSGLQHNSARLGKWLEILVVEDLTLKERRPNWS